MKITSKIILFLFFLFPCVSFSSSKADSLELKLNKSTGCEKVSVLIELAKSQPGEFPYKSINYGKRALELSASCDDKLMEAKAYNSLGITYYGISEFDKSLENFQQALHIFEMLNYQDGIVNTLNNISTVYTVWENYDKALEISFKTLDILKNSDDKYKLATLYNNIGVIYQNSEKPDNALIYHQKSLQLSKEIDDKTGIVNSLNNIGVIVQYRGDNKAALDYYLQAVTVAETIDNYTNLAIFYNNCATIYIDAKDFPAALVYLEKSLKDCEKTGQKNVLQNTYKLYSDLYEKNGNCEKSFEYYKLYASTKDSVFNNQKSSKIAEMQARFEVARKEKEVEVLKKENEINELRSTNLERTRIFLVITIILVIVLITTNISRIYRKKKNNRE